MMEILDIFLQVINFAGKMMKEEDENVVFDVADLNAKRRAISADSDGLFLLIFHFAW